jgi:hypothetical protein
VTSTADGINHSILVAHGHVTHEERSLASLWGAALVGAGMSDVFLYSYGDRLIALVGLRYSTLDQV